MEWWAWLIIALLATDSLSTIAKAITKRRGLSDSDKQKLSDIEASLRRIERKLDRRPEDILR